MFARALALLATLAIACTTYAPKKSKKSPKLTERTLWQMCWTQDGSPLHPSDRYPHTPRCANPAPIKWNHLPIRVAIDESISDYRGWVLESMWIWNRAVGIELFSYDANDPDVIVIMPGDSPRLWGIALHRIIDGRLIALVGIYKGALGPIKLRHTVTHELGHVLGLSHDRKNSPRSVMIPGSKGEGTAPTRADIEAIRGLYAQAQ